MRQFPDSLAEVVLQLSRHKLRSLLTALSVLWGTFAFTVLLASGDALKRGAQRVFARDAVDTIYMRGGRLSTPSGGHGIGTPVQLTNRDVALLRTRVPGVLRVDPTAGPQGKVTVAHGSVHGSFVLSGCEPDHLRLENAVIHSGRYINARDVLEQRKTAVLGKAVSELLFGSARTSGPIGEKISVAGMAYEVVGVFDDEGDEREQQTVYVPLTTAQRLHVHSDNVDDVWLELDMGAGVATRHVEQEVRRLMAQTHGFAPDDEEALQLWNRYALFQRIQRILLGIDGLNLILGLGTLLAGVVAVSNITLISVKERTEEIGISKALGATPRRILLSIMAESLFVTLLAGYLGVLLSAAAMKLLAAVTQHVEAFRDPHIDLRIVGISSLVLVAAGTFAGYTPARRAAKAQVVESLRGQT